MTPETLAEANAWLAKVRLDLRAARADLEAEPPITSDALFHCQQAVEKALMGFLAAHERPPSKRHDLETHGSLVLEIDPALGEVICGASPLSIYTSEFRYPGDVAEPDVSRPPRLAS